jgi:hypothetical protein
VTAAQRNITKRDTVIFENDGDRLIDRGLVAMAQLHAAVIERSAKYKTLVGLNAALLSKQCYSLVSIIMLTYGLYRLI